MTYSGTLDDTAPGQGEFARLGAGRIRALTKAVKERLASLFVNPDADPLKFIQPVAGMVTTDYVFPPGSIIPSLTAALVTVPVAIPVGAVIPDNSPVVVNWLDVDAYPTVGAYIIHGWYVGGDVKAEVHNPTVGADGDASGMTLRLTVFYLATP